jgi:hypothetical protein
VSIEQLTSHFQTRVVNSFNRTHKRNLEVQYDHPGNEILLADEKNQLIESFDAAQPLEDIEEGMHEVLAGVAYGN